MWYTELENKDSVSHATINSVLTEVQRHPSCVKNTEMDLPNKNILYYLTAKDSQYSVSLCRRLCILYSVK